MLQIYDKLRAPSLLALAAATGALIALPAAAETACDLSDGYGSTLVSYVEEVQACLATSTAFDAGLEDEIAGFTNSERSAEGLDGLARRASLDDAARAHALDMAERQYAGHLDLEGRGHVYRMRAIDRQLLTGATGANVVVLPAGTSAEDIYEMIRSDEANRQNISHAGFTDTGIGVAKAGDTLYVVQMLTTVDGELKSPMPLAIADATSFQPEIREAMFRTAGWNLSDADGNRLAGGKLMRVHADNLGAVDQAYLDVLVELDADTYVLKGPMVSLQ